MYQMIHLWNKELSHLATVLCAEQHFGMSFARLNAQP